MRNFMTKLLSDRDGAPAIEYGLIAAFIGVGIIAYTMWNAQRTAARAMDIIERHPDLLVKSGALV